MNRYWWEGVARDLAAGRSVVYVGRGVACRAAFESIAELMPEAARVFRANGDERIEHPSGGSLRFRRLGAWRHNLRGLSADVVVLDDADADLDFDLVRELTMCVAGSPHGEVLRAC